MSTNPREELEEGIRDLERVARAGGAPSHRHARAVLVPLGMLLLEGSLEGIEETAALLERVVEPIRPRWRAACASELSMACTEHVQSVDPRYLDLENYDFEYTVTARERLEARLRAAELVGVEVGEELLDRVAKADELLEPYLRRREQRGGDWPG